jgi:ABC-2 type transport system permease protein
MSPTNGSPTNPTTAQSERREREPGARRPPSGELIKVVATREITTRLRDRTFLISFGVLLAIIAASVVLPLVLTRNADRPEFTLALSGAPAQAVGMVAKQAGAQAIALEDRRKNAQDAEDPTGPGPAVRIGDTAVPTVRLTLSPVADDAVARALVRDQTADAALVGTEGRLTLVAVSKVDGDLARLVALAAESQQVTDALQRAGVDAAQARTLLAAQPPEQRFLDPSPPNEGIVIFLGLAFAGLFFMTSFGFGMLIAQSVVEEKQSRVVELLVAAIPVRTLLAGKVLGNTALALGQVVLLMAVGLASAAALGQSAVTTLLLHSGGWFLLFFVLGFAMLACLWAAAGALSARQEDLQATTTPMQVLIFVPFFASLYATDPGPWLTALSYIPFSAPLTMPRRLLLGDAAWWEPILSAAGILVTAALLVALAARIYQGALLRTGTRTSLRAAWQDDGQPVA